MSQINVAAMTLALVMLTQVSAADENAKHFDIATQPLATALGEFARQSGRQILFSTEVAADKRTGGVKGELEPEAALRALLKGTGLTYRITADDTLLVDRPQPDVQGRPGGAGAGYVTGDAKDRILEQLEEIVVTGSWIRAGRGPSPVQTYSRADIQERGSASVARFLRTIPQNYNSAVPETAFFDATALTVGNTDLGFASSVNLRGVGADSTLTLLNGRRIAPSGGSAGAITDISMIPLAAVERIEVLPDGASAIYGADAIGGVVNVILRDRYEGFETNLRYSNDMNGGVTGESSASLVGGFGSPRARLLGGLEYFDQETLHGTDRGLTSGFDKRQFGGRDDRSIFVPEPGNVAAADGFLDALNRATDIFFDPVPVPAGQDGTALTPADFDAAALPNVGPNEFPFAVAPGERRYSGFLNGDLSLGGSLSAFVTALYTDRSVEFNTTSPSLFAVLVPAANPFNPFGEDVFVNYSMNREFPLGLPFKRENSAMSLVGGLTGRLASIGRGSGWVWETVLSRAEDEFAGDIRLEDADAVSAALGQTDPATALNVFGDQGRNDPAIVADLIRVSNVSGTSRLSALGAKAEGPLLEMPGGALRAAVGAEYRDEDNEFQNDLLGDTFTGDRNVTALFAELRIPLLPKDRAGALLERIDLSAAGRWEDYSDFGSRTSPKIGFVVGGERAVLRGSWARSFKAPLLREVLKSGSEIDQFVFDTNAPGGPTFVIVPVLGGGGNPDLRAETADVLSLGTGFYWGAGQSARFELNAGYFSIDFEDRVVQPSSDQLFQLEAQDLLPPGLVVRDDAGNLERLVALPLNFAATQVEGIDFSFTWRQAVGQRDELSLAVAGVRYLGYENQIIAGQPIQDVLGTIGWPVEVNGHITLGWARGALSANLIGNYVDSYVNDLDPVVFGTPDRVDSWSTLDLNAQYAPENRDGWLEGLRIGVGFDNLLDEEPPFVQGLLGYDPSRASVRGRSYFVELSYSF